MKLRDVMVKEVANVAPEETTANAARKMRELSVGCLVVTVDSKIKGILTDRDLLGCVSDVHDASQCKVASHMTRPVIVERPEEDLLRAAEVMAERRIKRLPVVEHGVVVGLVSFSDIAERMDDQAQACWSLWSCVTRLIRAQTRHRRAVKTGAAIAS